MEPPPLAAHPFLRSLSAAQAERLRPCARPVTYEAGGYVFREGAPADTLYLLHAGRIALEQHVPGQGPVTLENLGGGDLLGLSWLLPDSRWTLDARCVEAVQAHALRADCVLAQMARDPALGLALMTHVVRALYQRLVRVRLQRLDLYRTEA